MTYLSEKFSDLAICNIIVVHLSNVFTTFHVMVYGWVKYRNTTQHTLKQASWSLHAKNNEKTGTLTTKLCTLFSNEKKLSVGRRRSDNHAPSIKFLLNQHFHIHVLAFRGTCCTALALSRIVRSSSSNRSSNSRLEMLIQQKSTRRTVVGPPRRVYADTN